MKTSTLASLFFSGLALAGPLRKRGDDIFTDVIIETVWTTTTIYVDGPTDAAFFEVASSTASSTSSVASSSSVAVSSSAPPPPPSAAPAPSAAPQLKVAEVKPVVPVPAVKEVVAAPASNVMSGQATWYDVSVGLGSCGKQKSNSDYTVALSATYMQNGANPNANPLCGRKIILQYNNGPKIEATVDDTCPGAECTAGDVDLSPELFKKVFPNGDGRVKSGFTWYLA